MAFVGGQRAASSSGATLSVTYSPTHGNTLIIFFKATCTTAPGASGGVTSDNGSGSVYVRPATGGFVTNGSICQWINYTTNIGTSVTSITFTITGGGTVTFPEIVAIEFSSIGAFDVCNSGIAASWSTGSNNVIGTAVTTSVANDLVVAYISTFSGGGTLSVGTTPITWTSAAVGNLAAGFNFAEYGTITSAGSVTPHFNDTVADSGADSFTIAFEPPAPTWVPPGARRRYTTEYQILRR